MTDPKVGLKLDTPLWKCPKCGAKFVNTNNAHACGDYSVEKFLQGKGARARELFDRFEALVAQCGPYEIAPAKTRIAFMERVRFASINRIDARSMSVHVVLHRRLESPRFAKIEELLGVYVHHFRVSSADEIDGEVLGWLKESYEMYGRQGRLRR